MDNTNLATAIARLDIRIAKPVTSALITNQQNTITSAYLDIITKCVGITTQEVSDKASNRAPSLSCALWRIARY